MKKAALALLMTLGLGFPGVGVVCLASGAPAPASSTGRVTGRAQALLEQVLRRYGSYGDFEARFTETAISRASGEGTPETGTVAFKRPEMWRWEYLEPERKIVVIRGSVATIAVDGESDVMRYDLGPSDQRSGVGALLAGSEAVASLFTAEEEPSGTAEEPLLRLEPTRLSDEYDHVLLRVRRRDLTVLEVVVVDPGGNSLRFRFSSFRAGVGMPVSVFEPPEGSAPTTDSPGRPGKP